MDRYQGPEPMNAEEAHALALLMTEREEWEHEAAAAAEYESWHAEKERREDAHN